MPEGVGGQKTGLAIGPSVLRKFCVKNDGGISLLRKTAEQDFQLAGPTARAPMTVDQRTDAIRRFQEHEAEAQRRAAERERQSIEDIARWKGETLLTINLSVYTVSEDFADRGSPFLFSAVPVQIEGSAIFRVKTSTGHRLLPKLHFDLAEGQVTATATVPGAELPSTVPVRDVTGEWVEQAAERALIAMLNAA